MSYPGHIFPFPDTRVSFHLIVSWTMGPFPPHCLLDNGTISTSLLFTIQWEFLFPGIISTLWIVHHCICEDCDSFWTHQLTFIKHVSDLGRPCRSCHYHNNIQYVFFFLLPSNQTLSYFSFPHIQTFSTHSHQRLFFFFQVNY